MVLYDCGQAGFCLHGRCERRPVFPRCRLSVPTQRNIDHARIECLDVLITEAEARERTRAEILDDDISIAAEPGNDLSSLCVVQVDADILLSGILLHIIKAD